MIGLVDRGGDARTPVERRGGGGSHLAPSGVPDLPERRGEEPLYVEVTPLLLKHLTGVSRFVARLVEALARQTPLRLVTTIDRDTAHHMNLSTALLSGEEIAVTAADLPTVPDDDLGVWTRRLLRRPHRPHDPRLAGRCAALFTMLRPSERHFRRELCILYDFTPILVPWAHVPETREQFGYFFAESSALCEKAIAISRATRADAGWLSALRPEDVVVGHPGPSLCARSHAHPDPVTRTDRLILVVAALEPRKNPRFLLDWFLETAVLPPRAQLWWVGPRGWLDDSAERARRVGARGREVQFLGMVTDRQLCALYQRAAFTIYPSLYEGFGFPVLDALMHGTPVVSSFNSSLAEFEGAGVYYFDPCDAASLDAACRELLGTLPLRIDRDDLRERCSWDRLARTVLSLSR